MKLKIFVFSLLAVFLFYFSIFISGFIPLFASYKTDFTSDLLAEYSLNVLFHPIKNIAELMATENPLIYFTLIGSLVLLIYLIFKMRTKEYQIVGKTYGVQGSARWASKGEIFNAPEQLTIVPIKGLQQDIENSLKGVVNND
ncbi:hypothetical protein P8881_19785 [Bacillus haynesii]|uniref:hypothetical protein n=1 Tax=Bacillus haynesii TaxID=1925021 RepID=UPI002280FF2E|nr:hypothetical protein [Bacillus haynesii]MCY8737576.1 hypothetical protein [Bacillus haynesii]MEC0709769.1 hypothetical protein [Bacillus haynesii]MEC0736852.1 hypothetical protein [Bacillus haynesii]